MFYQLMSTLFTSNWIRRWKNRRYLLAWSWRRKRASSCIPK